MEWIYLLLAVLFAIIGLTIIWFATETEVTMAWCREWGLFVDEFVNLDGERPARGVCAQIGPLFIGLTPGVADD